MSAPEAIHGRQLRQWRIVAREPAGFKPADAVASIGIGDRSTDADSQNAALFAGMAHTGSAYGLADTFDRAALELR